MTEQKWIEKLKGEGFTGISVTPLLDPNLEFGEHTHEQATVHVVLEGELILIEKDGVKNLQPGFQFEIPAGTTHNAKTGPEGMKMIVGVKNRASP